MTTRVTTSVERARKVREHGTPEPVGAVERGELAVSSASSPADEPATLLDQVLTKLSERGAKPTKANIRKVVRELRGLEPLPTPAQARKLAAERGGSFLASDGRYHGPSSPAQIREEIRLAVDVGSVVDALETLAAPPFSPGEFNAKVPPTSRYQVDETLAAAHDWLSELFKVWGEGEEKAP